MVSKGKAFGRAPQRSKILIVQAPLRVNFAIQVWIAKEGAFVREKPPRKTPILYNPEEPPGGRFFCCRRIFQHPATGNSAAHSFPRKRNLADCPIAFFTVSCFIIFFPFFPAPPRLSKIAVCPPFASIPCLLLLFSPIKGGSFLVEKFFDFDKKLTGLLCIRLVIFSFRPFVKIYILYLFLFSPDNNTRCSGIRSV